MASHASPTPRRPLKTRSRRSAQALGRWLAQRRVTPNAISISGVALAAGAAVCLALLPSAQATGAQVALLLATVVFIQLRLASNLLDGLVAVEGGMATPTGPLFNEVPDRIADLLILVSVGYAIGWVDWAPELGWLAGTLAVLTAYARLLGGSLGLEQRFSGPMAKPQRMATLTLGCLASVVEAASGDFDGVVLTLALLAIVIGSALTFVLRLAHISAGLRAR